MSETLSTHEKLVYMANQIAKNFATQEQAAASAADHMRKFWDPRMRAQILAHAAAGGAGLEPIAREAITLLRKL